MKFPIQEEEECNGSDKFTSRDVILTNKRHKTRNCESFTTRCTRLVNYIASFGIKRRMSEYFIRTRDKLKGKIFEKKSNPSTSPSCFSADVNSGVKKVNADTLSYERLFARNIS